MIEGFDWQPVLIAAIALMSLINGLSVFQNYRSDRAIVQAEPVFEDDWMYWTKVEDPKGDESVRRYAVIGHMAQSNLGRRPTSIANAELRIRLRNRRTATSPLYEIAPPVLELQNAESQRLPVMKPGPDPFDFRPMLHPGQSMAGIHCFLFGMYGSDMWAPKTVDGILPGTITLESGFGTSFKSDVEFRYVEYAALERLFPGLGDFVGDNLEADEA
ncbi:MAG: hypothetical protein AAF311_15110 [Pseudomonadota bacterium]